MVSVEPCLSGEKLQGRGKVVEVLKVGGEGDDGEEGLEEEARREVGEGEVAGAGRSASPGVRGQNQFHQVPQVTVQTSTQAHRDTTNV